MLELAHNAPDIRENFLHALLVQHQVRQQGLPCRLLLAKDCVKKGAQLANATKLLPDRVLELLQFFRDHLLDVCRFDGVFRSYQLAV